MKQVVQQAKVEMKCIFCGTTTYFEDNNKAYCIDCYCKIRNSAHTYDPTIQAETHTDATTIEYILKQIAWY